MEQIEELVERLPRLRAALELRQQDLAALVGVTQATISAWETGDDLPSRRNERALRRVLAEAVAGVAA